MLTFLTQHAGEIVVCLMLLLIVTAVILRMVKDRRAGKSSCGCGCGCGSCPNAGACHPKTTRKEGAAASPR